MNNFFRFQGLLWKKIICQRVAVHLTQPTIHDKYSTLRTHQVLHKAKVKHCCILNRSKVRKPTRMPQQRIVVHEIDNSSTKH